MRRDGVSIVGWDSVRELLTISNGDRRLAWEHQRDMFALPAMAAIMAVTVLPLWRVAATEEARAGGVSDVDDKDGGKLPSR